MYELVAARRVLFAWPEQRRLQNQLPDNVITRDATCTNFTPDSPPFFPFHPISSLSPPPDYSWNAISTPIFPQRRSKSSDKHRLEENSRTCINWQGEKSREENYYRFPRFLFQLVKVSNWREQSGVALRSNGWRVSKLEMQTMEDKVGGE